jgi:hypothetical protein
MVRLFYRVVRICPEGSRPPGGGPEAKDEGGRMKEERRQNHPEWTTFLLSFLPSSFILDDPGVGREEEPSCGVFPSPKRITQGKGTETVDHAGLNISTHLSYQE